MLNLCASVISADSVPSTAPSTQGFIMTTNDLRTRAEDFIRLTRRELKAFSEHDVQRVVHELQVHQVELEMQNESLRSAQTDLEEAHAHSQELFECAPIGYVMLEGSGVVVRANASAIALLGVQLPELLQRPLQRFLEIEGALLLDQQLQRSQPSVRTSCEVRLCSRAHDDPRDIRLDISVIPSRRSHRLVTLTDISEQKRNLEALERLNEELEGRVEARTLELAERNRELEEEIATRVESETKRRQLEMRLRDAQHFESLGVLAGGIAHDFNNLLVGVLGNAELMLLKSELSAEWRESLEMIRSACRRASDLTRQLLAFAGQAQQIMSAIKLPNVVAESLELVRTRVPKGVQLQTQITADVPEIDADRGQVNQIVMNLVTNAIEAVANQGMISVKVSFARLDADQLAAFQHSQTASPGGFVVLQVRDSGPGIDDAILARIFDPFFSTKFAGRGLGLASVLGIVHSHHAALRVENTPGTGASFEVAFPIAARRPESERPRSASELESCGAGTVLLVEDDDAVRRVVAKMLTQLGFDVVAAIGGEEGLERFVRGDVQFDFIVLDWIMPGFSGEKLLAALRELSHGLPVIVISGYSAENLATRGEGVIFVQKPMTLTQLRAAVCELDLAAHRAAKQPVRLHS